MRSRFGQVYADPRALHADLPASYCGEDRGDQAERGREALKAIAAVNGQQYGDEYLTFAEGAAIVRMRHTEEEEGWHYGARLANDGGTCGASW